MIDAALTAALTDAVRELERRSCAELVVEMRSRSGSYAHADARFGALVALLTLAVLLFSPWSFAPLWVLVDSVIAYTIGLFVSRKSDAVRRVMTTPRERVAAARTMAAAVFHERGVMNTRRESGVLLFLSLLERRIELLADRGVLEAVPSLEWNRIDAAAREKHATPARLVDIIRELTPLLERHLPVEEGDVDELCDAPRFVTE